MAQQGTFKKSLSTLDLTFLGLGAIIGSGWLFASQAGAQLAGSDAWMAWIFGAIAVALIGLVYAEMGSAMPRSGGIIRYPEYTHGSLVSFIMGFASLLAYSSVAGIEVEAVRGYAQFWWPALGTAAGGPTAIGIVVQILLLVVFFLLNFWSVNIFGKVNSFVTAIKFIVPTLTLIILFTQIKVSNFHVGGANPGGLHGVAQAISTAGIVFAFLGFRQAIDFAGEAKNPQRSVPRAVISAIAIGAVVYVLLQLSFIGSVPASQLHGGWGGVSFKSPFAGLATVLGFGWLANILLIDAVISPAGTGNIYLSSTARVVYAWSKTGTFFRVFAKIDPRSGVPRAALILTFLLSIIWTLPVKFQAWDGLVSAVTSATVMTYLIGPVSAAALRRTAPNMVRPFRLAGMRIIAPLAFMVASCIVYWAGWATDSLLIYLIAIAIVVYALYFSFVDRTSVWHNQFRTEFGSGVWLIVYYVFIYLMSRYGTFGPSSVKNPAIGAPWDTVIVALGGLVFYYWGVASALKTPRITEDEDSTADADVVGSTTMGM